MKYWTPIYWFIPCIFAILAAMQFARWLPQMPPSLQRWSAPLAKHAPSYRQTFTTSSILREKPSTGSRPEDAATQKKNHIRGLPEPVPQDQRRLDINSDEGLRFDHLGPIVVNKDGSMSRITNWDKMAAVEKENTLRVLGKRNKARLEALKKKEKEEEEEAGKGEGV